MSQTAIPLLRRRSSALPEAEPQQRLNRPKLVPLSKSSRLIRITLFLILELAYIAFALFCLHKPVFLPESISQSESKGAFTVILIVWQTLAITPVREIIAHIFSSEWFSQLSRTGTLIPGTTDKVSLLTASLTTRIAYLVTSTPSVAFRLALVISIVFVGLTSIAPGTINTGTLFINTTLALPIGTLTVGKRGQSGDLDGTFLLPQDRSTLIVHLEQIEKSQFGYAVDPLNWLFAWPSTSVNITDTIVYPTDGVHFQYQCQWEIPLHNESSDSWFVREREWTVWMEEAIGLNDPTSAISPLAQVDVDHNDTLSAYLFLGGNSTFNTGSLTGLINLEGIPAAYNATGFFLVGPVNTTGEVHMPHFASALVCDLQMSISGLTIARESTNKTLKVISSDPARVQGNISPTQAALLFSEGLLLATSQREPYGDTSNYVNYISALLFLTDPTMNESNIAGTKPLNLEKINSNMDAFILSASKAYVEGYRPLDDWLPVGDFFTENAQATRSIPKLGLITSVPFLIGTTSAVGILAVLLCVLTVTKVNLPFGLESILGEVKRRDIDIDKVLGKDGQEVED